MLLSDMQKAIFYAVSTGAGNPDLLTLQAVKVLKECRAIFYPESEKNTIALDSISKITGLELTKKELFPCHFSMTKNEDIRKSEYDEVAARCENFLNEGKSVAMLSIGDVSLYSTAARTASLIKKHGFNVEFIAGVNSFSAAAASSAISLCKKDEKLTIIPGDAFYIEGKLEYALKDQGSKILMKMGRHLEEIISLLDALGLIQNSTLVQKASLDDEKIFQGEEIKSMTKEDLKNAYLSVMIVN